MNNLLEAKERLLSKISRTARWRDMNVKKFPSDAGRNQNSSKELYKLFDYITDLGSDHPIFRNYLNLNAMDRDMLSENLRRYGFGFMEEDASDFIYEKMFKRT